MVNYFVAGFVVYLVLAVLAARYKVVLTPASLIFFLVTFPLWPIVLVCFAVACIVETKKAVEKRD